MSGNNPHVKRLESRKQLLIVESELNRVQLQTEIKSMANEVGLLARRAKTIGVIGPVIVSLVGSLATPRGKAAGSESKKNPWWSAVVSSAGFFSSLWSEFRAQKHKPRNGNRRD
jgi:hypothetical protein